MVHKMELLDCAISVQVELVAYKMQDMFESHTLGDARKSKSYKLSMYLLSTTSLHPLRDPKRTSVTQPSKDGTIKRFQIVGKKGREGPKDRGESGIPSRRETRGIGYDTTGYYRIRYGTVRYDTMSVSHMKIISNHLKSSQIIIPPPPP